MKNPYVNPKDLLGINKVPLHLIPPVALMHEAMAMWTGAAKYGPYNWRENNVVASIYVAAAQRHLSLWFDGEEFAGDGVHHLGHVRACLGIILDAMAGGNLIDDRPPKGASPKVMADYNRMLKYCNDAKTIDWEEAHGEYTNI